MPRRSATLDGSAGPARGGWPATWLRSTASPLAERPVRLLWASQLVSEVGDWAARIAVTALVYDRTHSSALAAVAFVAGLLPWLGPGQLLATLADRHGRRELMIVSDAVRAVIFLGLAVLPLPAWGVLVAVALAGLASPPFEAARSAALVEYTSAARLSGAIRLSSATYDAGTLLGYAGGALLMAVSTPAWACAVDAATFAVSAAFVAALPRRQPSSEAPSSEAPAGGVTAGGAPVRGAVAQAAGVARAMWADPLVRAGAVLGVLPVATGTALESQVVPWASADCPGWSWLPGVVLALSTAVCLVLTLVLTERPRPEATLVLAGLLTAVTCAAVAVLCLLGPPAAVAVALVVAGALFVPIVLAQTVVSPRLAPDRRATSFGLLMGLLTLAQAVAAPVAGALTSAVGAPRGFALVCAVAGAAALAAVRGPALRGARPRPGSEGGEPA